ncbi:MAG: ester cyclase [candidate division KSB1 bacterium]|nr:ester cyclase [candidate division KSB1 bacterium]MDZ7367005.1 ester cyclase [candidate division KSB1 bacterium]MDZ7406790.1 ester cyclase [candidate division KSB1 bacterium]
MKKTTSNPIGVITTLLLNVVIISFASCSGGDTPEIQAMKAELKKIQDERAMIEQNLATFDTLDFTVFSNQQWTRFHESHAKDIKVYWPDGHTTQGLDVHIEDLKALFVHAPDTRIKEHPIRFGSGKYTAVTGVFEGTFTKPMPIGGGKFIQPTGKAFKMPMATIGIWENGVMTEEHLFWDNQTYMKQIGLAK